MNQPYTQANFTDLPRPDWFDMLEDNRHFLWLSAPDPHRGIWITPALNPELAYNSTLGLSPASVHYTARSIARMAKNTQIDHAFLYAGPFDCPETAKAWLLVQIISA